MRRCDFDQMFELRVFVVSQVRKLQNQYFHDSTGDGTFPQAIPRSQVGGAHDNFG